MHTARQMFGWSEGGKKAKGVATRAELGVHVPPPLENVQKSPLHPERGERRGVSGSNPPHITAIQCLGLPVTAARSGPPSDRFPLRSPPLPPQQPPLCVLACRIRRQPADWRAGGVDGDLKHKKRRNFEAES